MKKMGAFRLAMVYAGCFLGAGYVSGQELWQFFGAYGAKGYIGLALAMVLLFLFSFLVLHLVRKSGETAVDLLIVPWNVPWLRFAVGAMETVFLFGVVAIMDAGVGALGKQLFDFPAWLGSLIFSALVFLLLLSGMRGVVSAFSVSVPVLVAVTVLFGILTLSRNGFAFPKAVEASAGGNALLGGWGIGAVTFACYNVFSSIGIFAPVGMHIKSRKTSLAGLALGVFALAAIAMSVLVSMHLYPETAGFELPMLQLAAGFGRPFVLLYALLLVLAMFGTACSSSFGVLHYLQEKFPRVGKQRMQMTLALVFLSWLSGLAGFGGLIGVLYPVFGYASAAFFVTMFIHAVKLQGIAKNT